MDTRHFYGVKTSRYNRHLRFIVSSSMPTDGDDSDVDDVGDAEDGGLIDDCDLEVDTAAAESSSDDGQSETSDLENKTDADGWSKNCSASNLLKQFDADHSYTCQKKLLRMSTLSCFFQLVCGSWR